MTEPQLWEHGTLIGIEQHFALDVHDHADFRFYNEATRLGTLLLQTADVVSRLSILREIKELQRSGDVPLHTLVTNAVGLAAVASVCASTPTLAVHFERDFMESYYQMRKIAIHNNWRLFRGMTFGLYFVTQLHFRLPTRYAEAYMLLLRVELSHAFTANTSRLFIQTVLDDCLDNAENDDLRAMRAFTPRAPHVCLAEAYKYLASAMHRSLELANMQVPRPDEWPATRESARAYALQLLDELKRQDAFLLYTDRHRLQAKPQDDARVKAFIAAFKALPPEFAAYVATEVAGASDVPLPRHAQNTLSTERERGTD